MPDEQNDTPSPTATGAWASAPAFSLSPTSSTEPPPLSNRDNPRSEATPTRPACDREATERQTDREQQQHVTLQEKPSCPILTARAIQVQPQFQYPMDTREEHCQWEIQQQQQITWLQETPIRQRSPGSCSKSNLQSINRWKCHRRPATGKQQQQQTPVRSRLPFATPVRHIITPTATSPL